jgi:hypothetical protein
MIYGGSIRIRDIAGISYTVVPKAERRSPGIRYEKILQGFLCFKTNFVVPEPWKQSLLSYSKHCCYG